MVITDSFNAIHIESMPNYYACGMYIERTHCGCERFDIYNI